MGKPTALILNDTTNAYHWGCYGTSTELRLTLEDLGYVVTAFGVADVHLLKTPPKTGHQMTDLGFRRAFLADNPKLASLMANSDLILVNGEGTLHGVSQAALNLLYITNLAKSEFGKIVHAVNMSLFPSDARPVDRDVGNLYREMLQPIDQVVVREPRSYEITRQIGLDAHLGFDCLPRYLERIDFKPETEKTGAIVLGGGLGLDPKIFCAFLKSAEPLIGDRSLIYVTGAKANDAQDDSATLGSLGQSGLDVEHQVLSSFHDWATALSGADCLISGRFHHTIAAAFLGTPMVTFRGGTPKIDGLFESLAFSSLIDSAGDDAIASGLSLLKSALEHREPTLPTDRRASLIRLASLNFEELG